MTGTYTTFSRATALRVSLPWIIAGCLLSSPGQAHASLFEGETLDKVAEGLSWAVMFLVPAVGITVFWLLHIMPEKVAEKRKHPQAKAIQCLCLLSLFFGGLLWPIAWLWAYSKPVLYKMAYGKDEVDHHPPPEPTPEPPAAPVVAETKANVKKEGGQS